MAEFKGLIGLEQLSPEVRTFIENMIQTAIANAGGNLEGSKVDNMGGTLLKGRAVLSKNTPTSNPDVWIQMEDENFPNSEFNSSKILVVESGQIPDNIPVGQIVVEIEK